MRAALLAITVITSYSIHYTKLYDILKAANAVIANNAARMGKQLWTQGHEGEPIELYSAYNDLDEARYVVERIQSWVNEGRRRDEIAVLYRSNAQSRLFEEELLRADVPYTVA